jgi:diacylglycerol kinase (ATP)
VSCTDNDENDIGMDQQPGSEFKSKGGIKRIYAAIVYSAAGLRSAWQTEYAFRQEVIVSLPATLVALLLPVPALQKLALIAVLLLLLIVELVNSAIEAVVDRISLERHPLSKSAKDLGSAAVCLAMSLAAITWAVIVLPLLFS